jgi:DNA-binding NarL/FixJ family response regulator
MNKTTVVLFDLHTLFRQGLASLIDSQPDWNVVGHTAFASEAVTLIRNLEPDVVLMDTTLLDGTGLEAARKILAARPATRIVFLSTQQDDDLVFEAIRLGAKGYLPKDLSVVDLLGYLRGVARGEPALTPALASRVLEAFARQDDCGGAAKALALPGADKHELGGLTRREKDVLNELMRGASNREIADRLVISENTVKHHVGNILSKLSLRNRRDLTRVAHQA